MKWMVVAIILGVGLVGGFLFLYAATHIRGPGGPPTVTGSDPVKSAVPSSEASRPVPQDALDTIDWEMDLPRLRRFAGVEKPVPSKEARKEVRALAGDLAGAERVLGISGSLLTGFEHPAVQERFLEAAIQKATGARLDEGPLLALRNSLPGELDLDARTAWAAQVVPAQRSKIPKEALRGFDDSCRAIFLFEPDVLRLPVGPGVTHKDRVDALLKHWQSVAHASFPAAGVKGGATREIASDWLRRGRAAVEELRKIYGDAVDQALANDKGLSKDPAAGSVEIRLALRAKMAALQMWEAEKLTALLPEGARREALARSQTKIFFVAAEA